MPDDALARRRALDPEASFIVRAPAGSGKTEILVRRVLRLLAGVEEPESIVAITFTRRAAAEMRARVLDALREAESCELPPAAQRRERWELARAALARDRERGWRLTENPARLRIGTVDAFCASLVARMPWQARLCSLGTVEAKPADLYRGAVRHLLESLQNLDAPARAALERLLLHLDNNWPRLETLLVAMLARRDQWLRPVAHGMRAAGLRASMEAHWATIVNAALVRACNAVPAALQNEAAVLAAYMRTNLPPEEAAKRAPAAATGDELTRWWGIADLLLTQDGERRRRVDRRNGFPIDTDAQRAMKARWQELRDQLDEPVWTALAAIPGLPTPAYPEAQWETLAALLEILPRAVAELKAEFQTKGKIDFSEISQAALAALGTEESPSDLAFALDARLQHLLVDEFQDTSRSQYDLLRALSREWTPDDGRTIFLVGDPMQSIYRFREAEVGLFVQVWENGLGRLPVARLQLERNFRSTPTIVEWVNRVFNAAFPPVADVAAGAMPYAPCYTERTEPSHAAAELHWVPDGKAEAEKVIELVQAARATRKEGAAKIAVLARTRSHLANIVPALLRAGIRFRALDIDPLAARVRDLSSLTRALVQPADRIAWLALLRAPWCGLSLADLCELAGDGATGTIWEALADDARLARLTSAGRAAALRIRPILAAALADRGRRPLGRWAEGVWVALGGPALLPNVAALRDAGRYWEMLRQLAPGANFDDPGTLEARLEHLYASPEVEAEADAIEILTIHKAKGLEFDTVILPGLDRLAGDDRPPLLLWQETITAEGAAGFLLAPISETGADRDPIYQHLWALRMAQDRHETTRLLYVAATRACRQLHLVARVRHKADGAATAPHKNSLLARVWPVVPAPPRWRAAPAAANHAPAEDVAPVRRIATGWQIPAPPAGIAAPPPPMAAAAEISFHWVGDMQRHVGTVVHATLRRMAATQSLTWNRTALAAALRAAGVPAAEMDVAVARAEEALRATIEDERGRWILMPHANAENELALAGALDGVSIHGRIDRTFVDENVRWIIDYKTGVHEGGGVTEFLAAEQARYQPQLDRYAALLGAWDGRPMRVGLFFPLVRQAPRERGWREWSGSPATTAAGFGGR